METKGKNLVEAAGVEPASEKAHHGKNYMLSRVRLGFASPDTERTRIKAG
jgi:hypothetical protein